MLLCQNDQILVLGANFFAWLKTCMYTDNSACIQIGDKVTRYFNGNTGVRQGDGMIPLLFSLFNISINDLANDLYLLNANVPYIATVKTACLLYADDLVLLSETEAGLQRSIDKVEQFCDEYSQFHVLDVVTEYKFRSNFL